MKTPPGCEPGGGSDRTDDQEGTTMPDHEGTDMQESSGTPPTPEQQQHVLREITEAAKQIDKWAYVRDRYIEDAEAMGVDSVKVHQAAGIL